MGQILAQIPPLLQDCWVVLELRIMNRFPDVLPDADGLGQVPHLAEVVDACAHAQRAYLSHCDHRVGLYWWRAQQQAQEAPPGVQTRCVFLCEGMDASQRYACARWLEAYLSQRLHMQGLQVEVHPHVEHPL
jgi:hypothetical protein